MGLTSNLLYSHFSFFNIKDLKKELGELCVKEPDLVFQGYKGKHYYKKYGSAEVIANTVEKDGVTTIEGMSLGVMGDKNCYLSIVDNYDSPDGDQEHAALCQPLDESLGGGFPVSFINGDVLPSYAPGTTVFGQVVCYATNLTLSEDPKELFAHQDEEAKNPLESNKGRILCLRRKEDGGECCFVWGRVKDYGVFPVSWMIGEIRHPGLPFLTVDTNLGELFFILPFNKVSGEEGKKLFETLEKEEAYVSMSFLMALDVAVGEYQEGAKHEESHLLRLLEEALRTGEFSRLENTLSDDVVVSGKRILSGKTAVLERMRVVYQNQKIEDKAVFGKLFTVSEVKDQKTVATEGKLGLRLFIPSVQRIAGDAFLFLNEEKKIEAITYNYEPDHYEVDLMDMEDILSFGVEGYSVRIGQRYLMEDYPLMLHRLLSGEEEDLTDFYASLSLNAVLSVAGHSHHRGRNNVYYWLREYAKDFGEKGASFQLLGGETVVSLEEDAFLFSFTVNDDGYIEEVLMKRAVGRKAP